VKPLLLTVPRMMPVMRQLGIVDWVRSVNILLDVEVTLVYLRVASYGALFLIHILA
jgi:hypothetical protein